MIEEIKDLQACFLPVQWRKEQDFMEKRLCHDKNCHRPDRRDTGKHPGELEADRKEIQRAREKGAHMLVLPEMCLTGYLIGDLWDQNAFLRECEVYNEK